MLSAEEPRGPRAPVLPPPLRARGRADWAAGSLQLAAGSVEALVWMRWHVPVPGVGRSLPWGVGEVRGGVGAVGVTFDVADTVGGGDAGQPPPHRGQRDLDGLVGGRWLGFEDFSPCLGLVRG